MPAGIGPPVSLALAKAVDRIPTPGALPSGCLYEPKWDGFLHWTVSSGGQLKPGRYKRQQCRDQSNHYTGGLRSYRPGVGQQALLLAASCASRRHTALGVRQSQYGK